MWSSIKVHLVDALAAEGDEGRCSLRYASGSRQTDFDPGISEWGTHPTCGISAPEYIGCRSELGELKYLSTRRKRNQPRFPQ